MTQTQGPTARLTRFADVIEARLGLDFRPRRLDELRRYLETYLRTTSAETVEAFLERAGDGGDVDWPALTPHLTVGETYFFRDPGAMSALRGAILPALIERGRSRGRQLRIWSAGCGTGEEAYTLAILLEHLIPDLDRWDVRLLATDVNRRALAAAKQGVYRPWSLRETPHTVREADFTERPDGRFEIAPRIRARVTFEEHNLVDLPWPVMRFGAMDLILCRNVLLYFNTERVKAVFAELRRHLDPEGYLIVSPSELGAEGLEGFRVQHFDPGFALRPAEELTRPAPPPSRPPARRKLRRHAPPSSVEVGIDAVLPRAGVGQQSTVSQSIHDDPEWAIADCVRELAERPMDPTLHFVHAALLEETGDLAGAEESLRRALYLDPRFVLAHFLRGTVLARLRRSREARKHLVRAAALAMSWDAGEPLPFSNGMDPQALAQVITATAHRLGLAR